MTLRWRLSVALAVLAAAAAVATTFVAYAATKQELYGEVDDFLQARTRPFLERTPVRPGGQTPPIGVTFPGRDLGPGLGVDAHIQVLGLDGRVTASSGANVPVTEADERLARDGGNRVTRTTTVDGMPYRVMTSALPNGGAVQVARDISETHRVLAALRRQLTAIGLVVVAAATAAGWFIARRAAHPLEALTAAAERVAATGDLATPIATDRRDESGRVARAFAQMLAALARSRQQQQALAQDAAHELRTPLTSLRTNIEVLERFPRLTDDQRGAILRDLRLEMDEIGGLVDELVQLAADQRDDEPPKDVLLADLVQRQVDRAAQRSRRVLRVNRAGKSTVRVKAAMIERAVSNLLDNAAKFSPPESPIEVSVADTEVRVRDHGPGIPEADLERVFDRFYRADAARALSGSGLGLSIVRQAVEAHGGTVFARNHPEGGAEVGFRLRSIAP